MRVQGRMSRQAEVSGVGTGGRTRCTCLPQGPRVLLRSWGLGESFGAKSWNTWRGGKVGGRRSIPVGERLLVRKGTVKASFNFMAQHQVKAPQRRFCEQTNWHGGKNTRITRIIRTVFVASVKLNRPHRLQRIKHGVTSCYIPICS